MERIRRADVGVGPRRLDIALLPDHVRALLRARAVRRPAIDERREVVVARSRRRGPWLATRRRCGAPLAAAGAHGYRGPAPDAHRGAEPRPRIPSHHAVAHDR